MQKLLIKLVENPYELDMAKSVRKSVFTKEQGIANEIDFDVHDDTAVHFIALLGGKPVGTVRARFPYSSKHAKVERLAVLTSNRKQHVGSRLMKALHDHLRQTGVKKVMLNSQESAKGFYEKVGYRQEGELFEEVGIPHVKMTCSLI